MKHTVKSLVKRFGREIRLSGIEVEFIQDEGTRAFAVHMSGHYEVNELKAITADLVEANKFFERAIKDMDTREILEYFHRVYPSIVLCAEVISGFVVVIMRTDDGDIMDPIEIEHRGIGYGHPDLDEEGARIISDHNQHYNDWFTAPESDL